jgi:CRP/FNR family transcriptional regulator, dissimilatory nitrate respiration regulator
VASKSSRNEFLEHVRLFSGVHPFRLRRIAGSAIEVTARRGKIILQPGDTCSGIFLVWYGQIKLALKGAGRSEKVIDVIQTGRAFGLASLASEQQYQAEARALTETKLLFIPHEAILTELDENPRFARDLLAALSETVQRLTADLRACTLQTARQRVADFLLRSTEKAGASHDQHVVLATSKVVLASRLNITAEHLSRILSEFVKARLIRLIQNAIVIEDQARLHAQLRG